MEIIQTTGSVYFPGKRRITVKLVLLSFSLLFMMGNAQAATYEDVEIGGINLTTWCKRNFGNSFSAKLLGNRAVDWACQKGNDRNNTRPISATDACKNQYGTVATKAKYLNKQDPYSWRCFKQKRVISYEPIDMTPWCKKVFGNDFNAKFIGNNAGGWVCQRGNDRNDRRPISVTAACKVVYGENSIWGNAVKNWDDPHSWRCPVW